MTLPFKLKLKTCRAQLGLSQQDVAKILGVTSKAIFDYENGLHSPLMEKAQRLAEIYGLPVDMIDFSKEGNRHLTRAERDILIARLSQDDTVIREGIGNGD